MFDLVMSGHSHNYERSRMMKGYFGFESDFNATTYNLSQSSGTYQNASSCPYVKMHPTMERSMLWQVPRVNWKQRRQAILMMPCTILPMQSRVLYVYSRRKSVRCKWLASNGIVMDKFTILKNTNKVTILLRT